MLSQRQGPEYNDVQKPPIELLRDHFGYDYSIGEEVSNERSSEAEVLLIEQLADGLEEVNPDLSDSGVRKRLMP